MEKECCNVKVTETDNGVRIDLTGDKVKEKFKTATENCCTSDGCAEFFKNCFCK